MAFVRHQLVTIVFVAASFLGTAGVSAAQVVLADLNGDGIRDRIEASHAGTELVIHTSARRHIQHLRAPDRIVKVVVSDVNRDGLADIVITTRRSGLHVWLNSGRGGFRSARPRAPAPDWRPGRATGDTAPSSATDDNVFASGMGLLAANRARAPSPDASFRPFSNPRVHSLHRYARPRVPRGPPLVLHLI